MSVMARMRQHQQEGVRSTLLSSGGAWNKQSRSPRCEEVNEISSNNTTNEYSDDIIIYHNNKKSKRRLLNKRFKALSILLCIPLVASYVLYRASSLSLLSPSSLPSPFSSSSSFDNNGATGSWANCTIAQSSPTTNITRSLNISSSLFIKETASIIDNTTVDTTGVLTTTTIRSTTVSCHTISYRIDIPTFQKAKGIIIGVLSHSGGLGPTRRQSIRDTWGNTNQYENQNIHSMHVTFLVAGPWDAIRDEYETYGDLIWIDEEEVYDGEHSVLTYKTQSFINIVYDLVTELDMDTIKYVFKADDDCYIHMQNLYNQLLVGVEQRDQPRDYWGWCQLKKWPPNRDTTAKWPVSYELYPEPMYPRYCQGAGFALSWKFIECASSQNHISMSRYMPFEDVSMGVIAERCNIIPTMVETRRWINLYRTGLKEEENRVRNGLPKIDKSKLTRPAMLNRIVQHRIYDEWDMKEHHKVVMDPKRYNQESTVQWYKPP